MLTASIMGEVVKYILLIKLVLVGEAVYAAPFARSLLQRFLFDHLLPQNKPSRLVDFQVRRPLYD